MFLVRKMVRRHFSFENEFSTSVTLRELAIHHMKTNVRAWRGESVDERNIKRIDRNLISLSKRIDAINGSLPPMRTPTF